MGNILFLCLCRPRKDPVYDYPAEKNEELKSARTDDLPPVENIDNLNSPNSTSDDNTNAPMFDASENLAHVNEDSKQEKISIFAKIRRLASLIRNRVKPTRNFGEVYVVKEANPENTVVNIHEPAAEKVATNAEANNNDALIFDASENLEHIHEDRKEKKISIFTKIRRLISSIRTRVKPARTIGNVYIVKEANPEDRVINIQEWPVVEEAATNAEASSSDDTTNALMFNASENLEHIYENRKKKISIFEKIRRFISCVKPPRTVVGNVYVVKEANPENRIVNFQEPTVVEKAATNNAGDSCNDTTDALLFDASENLEHLHEDIQQKKNISIFGKIRRCMSCVKPAKTFGKVYVVKEANPEDTVVNFQEPPVVEDVATYNVQASLVQDLSIDSRRGFQPRRPPSQYGVKLELGLAARGVNKELPSLSRTIVQTNAPITQLVEGIAQVNRYQPLKPIHDRSRMMNRHKHAMKFRQRMREYRQRMSKVEDVDEDPKEE